MTKKECIAMLLAGGKGTRLKDLTINIAKPAVPYGGKYRIIDFALSNCKNSKIDMVGVLVHYQSHILENYICYSKNWSSNGKNGGITILSPNQSKLGYEGTAHAVYENLSYIDSHDPDYVLIISGDQIYKMDYNKILEQHKRTKADVTISVTSVPWSEASRFGIMNIDPDTNRILEFQEKPTHPKSNLASMGIYIFSRKVLNHYLEQEENNPYSSKDFGKDIIPAMIKDNCRLYSYIFEGYWKDVGTVESYWEANIDLLSIKTSPLLECEEWLIYTGETDLPPVYLDEKASIHQSLVSEGCRIFGKVENSVLFYGVKVGRGAIIKDSVILPNAIIEENAIINRSVIGCESVIEANVKVGESKAFSEITLIGEKQTVQKKVYEKII